MYSSPWAPLCAAILFVFAATPCRAEWLGGGPLPPNNSEIKSIIKRTDGRLVVGTKTGGVFIGDDGLTKWEIQALGFTAGDGRDVKSLLALPDGTLLAGTKNGVFRSVDGGERFIRSSEGLGDSSDSLDARYLTADPLDPSVIHLATKGGYYRSADGGLTWSRNNLGLTTPDQYDTKVVVVIPEPYTALIGAKHGVFASADPAGGPWRPLAPESTGQTEFKVMALNADSSSLYVFAKGQGEPSLPNGVYRSDDGGASFIPIPIPSGEEVKEYGFAPGPDNPDEIMASDKKGNLYRSFDRGAAWEAVPIPELNDEIKVLFRDPGDPDRVWHIGSKEGFFTTDNGGISFRSVREGLVSPAAEGKHVIVDPADPMKVYVATKTGLWYTDRGAETVGEGWIELTQEISTLFNLDIRRMLIDRANDPSGNTIYIAAKFDLFKYSLVGDSHIWLDSSQGIPPSVRGADKDIKWIEQDPDDPAVLYVTRKNEGGPLPVGEIFRSEDRGATWGKISSDDQFTGELDGDPKNVTIIGDELFVGTKGGMMRGNKNDPVPIGFRPLNDGFVPNEKGEIDIKQTALSPSGDLFASAKTGVYLLPRGASAWLDITGNLPAEKEGQRPDTEGIHYDAFGRLWVGAKKEGLFYSPDPARSVWNPIGDQLPEGKPREIVSITTAPGDSSRLYAGTKQGTFVNSITLGTFVPGWGLY